MKVSFGEAVVGWNIVNKRQNAIVRVSSSMKAFELTIKLVCFKRTPFMRPF